MPKQQPAPLDLHAALQQHFGVEPHTLSVIRERFDDYERANMHLALQEVLAEAKPAHSQLMGVIVPEEYSAVSLAKLSNARTAAYFPPGPVEYIDVPLASGRLSCVRRGLFLVQIKRSRLALLINDVVYSATPCFTLEVMSKTKEASQDLARTIVRETRFGRAFRGNVLSVEVDCNGQVTVNFHRLPKVGRKGLILPAPVLRRIERHTIGFSRNADKLLAAGRHLKRGVLLYGSPGTGKTLTAMYLAAQMTQRTVIVITGVAMGAIATACKLARMLLPATVIVEDVDLVGTERQHQTINANAVLFELLNQMDGLAEDADILFILTTNRPDVLEPALASRPGRVDQAIEIPLPDLRCRRRLLRLYAAGLKVDAASLDHAAKITDGASGAFIRELLRKAALLAADEPGPLRVRRRHMEEAVAELVISGGELTQSLLGSRIGGTG